WSLLRRSSGWHRPLVARRRGRKNDQPVIRPLALNSGARFLRLARENPRWGYRRLIGKLEGPGVAVSASTVHKLLREKGLGPAGIGRWAVGVDLQSPSSSPFACRKGRSHRRKTGVGVTA